MIEIQIKSATEPRVLAELIASTLHGHISPDPSSPTVQVGKLVREQQEAAERDRPSHQELQTVNFATIEPDEDWTDI